jgi:hypothetical protein
MALAGVPIGSVNAMPAGTATSGAMTRGSMPNCCATAMLTGITIATAAELLITSVSATVASEIIITTETGPAAHCEIVCCATHPAAPLLFSAEPRQIAPPYIRISPQFT